MIGLTRIHGKGFRESIAEAQRICGPTIMARLSHVQYVCGLDPVFAGLHAYANKGYDQNAHCCWPMHIAAPADRRVTTIVLPGDWSKVHPLWRVHVLVHELGHALHETMRLDKFDIPPVTEYAKTNRWEAFAEAFTAWRWPGNGYAVPDAHTIALFDSLT